MLFKEGTVPINADSLGQWRKSYRDITTKTVVSNTLDPPPASGILAGLPR